MNWKFWQKKEAATIQAQQEPMEWPTDSFKAVKMLVALFVGHDVPPFALWRADDAQLTAETERLQSTAVVVRERLEAHIERG